MDTLGSPFNGSMKGQWKRRQYKRLDGKSSTTPNRKKVKIIRLGGRSRRFWRIKSVPKFHFIKIASPLKLWEKLKNGYIKMMLSFAGNVSSLSNYGDFFHVKLISENHHRAPHVACAKKEFERKMVFENFKALMASKERGNTVTWRRLLSTPLSLWHFFYRLVLLSSSIGPRKTNLRALS